uniref:Uncharacterized protein n=1 Tax=Odontella aurita TaxID=265563 RepID=A0A7S4JCE7_9STRA|mmetsp:Transcript_43682/g.132898  ORF Transcript_43682/g.132898 Transcript_43682/m.132898 type:complete len:599 (+) Transcript_43682:94-1890(+)
MRFVAHRRRRSRGSEPAAAAPSAVLRFVVAVAVGLLPLLLPPLTLSFLAPPAAASFSHPPPSSSIPPSASRIDRSPFRRRQRQQQQQQRGWATDRHGLFAATAGGGAASSIIEGGGDEAVVVVVDRININSGDEMPKQRRGEKLILWRGEKSSGYSRDFRHCEFTNALAAVLASSSSSSSGDDESYTPPMPAPRLHFEDALAYDAEEEFSEEQAELFGSALQFVTTTTTTTLDGDRDGDPSSSSSTTAPLDTDLLVAAAQRTSLVRDVYEVLAEGESYEDLAQQALTNGSLNDVMVGGLHQKHTWRIRLRQYGSYAKSDKSRRVGKKVRSSLRSEKSAILEMKDLLIKFGGNVDLNDPQCSLYVMEGLRGRRKVLARLSSRGPRTSSLAPKERICVTNTPLEPTAAYSLCNVGRVRDGSRVLDPYAGSCATLLAAASISPACLTVGIEIAHDGAVNRDDIYRDFESRKLTPPAAIVRGSCASQAVRDTARGSIDGESFDAIVTDPPYGIRESTTDTAAESPLDQLLTAVIEDRDAGARLLKRGGRLVAFVPLVDGEDLEKNLPTKERMEEAGLVLTETKEQELNDCLSRWLVAFDCVR